MIRLSLSSSVNTICGRIMIGLSSSVSKQIRYQGISVLGTGHLGAGHLGTGNFGIGHLGTGNFGTE